MKVSAKGRYAIRAVINLSISDGKKKSVREVGIEEDISHDFLEKIFRNLKKGGIIESSRGAQGGFSLCKEPDDITVLEVLESIGEEFNPTPCASATENCGQVCDISYFWSITRDYVKDFFKKITISDIIQRKVNV